MYHLHNLWVRPYNVQCTSSALHSYDGYKNNIWEYLPLYVISLNELLTTDSSYNYCPYTYTVMSNIVMSTLNQADKSFSTESQGDE